MKRKLIDIKNEDLWKKFRMQCVKDDVNISAKIEALIAEFIKKGGK